MYKENANVFISDWEGPFGKNDYAMELSEYFIPKGAKIFALLSRYDDILAYILRRKDYGAGDTLKLILPFLKVYGATNDKIEKFAKGKTRLISGSLQTLRKIRSFMQAYIVSASYDICFTSIWKALDFPREKFYCTHLNIDEYGLSNDEMKKLKKIAFDIGKLTEIQRSDNGKELIRIPENATKLDDFPKYEREIIEKLDRYFWEDIYHMDSGRMLKEVRIVDSKRKAEAINEIIEKLGLSPKDAIYIGDSITDTLALRFLKEKGGLSISFNGNEYAIKEAEIAALSDNTAITTLLAYIFNYYGKEFLKELLKDWNIENVNKSLHSSELCEYFKEQFVKKLPRVEIISKNNIEILIKDSSNFRKKLRGEMIGELG